MPSSLFEIAEIYLLNQETWDFLKPFLSDKY